MNTYSPSAREARSGAGLRRYFHIVLLLVVFAAAGRPAEPRADRLSLDQVEDWYARSGLSFLVDLEGYYIDQRPPAFLFDVNHFVLPRFTAFFEKKLGDHFFVFAQARADRGFDPNAADRADGRMDEYLLRWMPFRENQLNLQAGKFATVVGSWVHRHFSWDSPFINAPLAYENMTTITDSFVPASAPAFLARRFTPEGIRQKTIWLPILWGPAYTSGASVFGSLGKFDYAFAVKNASISSRPTVWGVEELAWQNPTVEARLGFRPTPAWNHGVSFSHGTYLLPLARSTLPAGRDLEDYNQTTLGYDVSYAYRRWQLWGEVFAARFQVPNVGNADTLSYFLEAKYKITPQLFGALRWNQQLYGTVADGLGDRQTWGNNLFRVDTAIGYRFNRHLQGKLQYSYSHQNATWQKGEQLVAAQLTLKF